MTKNDYEYIVTENQKTIEKVLNLYNRKVVEHSRILKDICCEQYGNIINHYNKYLLLISAVVLFVLGILNGITQVKGLWADDFVQAFGRVVVSGVRPVIATTAFVFFFGGFTTTLIQSEEESRLHKKIAKRSFADLSQLYVPLLVKDIIGRLGEDLELDCDFENYLKTDLHLFTKVGVDSPLLIYFDLKTLDAKNYNSRWLEIDY